jgi:hypothetical protein
MEMCKSSERFHASKVRSCVNNISMSKLKIRAATFILKPFGEYQ